MIRIFKNLSRKDYGLFLLAVVLIVAQVWLDLSLPDYMADITKLIETEGSAMNDVLLAGGKMLGCALGSMLTACATAVTASRIASDFSANTRKKIYDAVQSFSLAEIHHFSTASLVNRTTNDVTQVQTMIVIGMQAIVKAPIEAVWAITKIANKNWQWTMSTAVAVVILMAAIGLTMGLCVPKFRKIQTLTDDLNRVTREDLTGLKVVHAYNAEEYQNEKFDKVNHDLTKTNLFTSRATAFLQPFMQAVMNGLTLSIYWIGAIIINQAQMTSRIGIFSDMIVFSSYAVQVVTAFTMLVSIFVLYPRASVSARRILEVTDMKPSIEDGTETEGKNEEQGTIRDNIAYGDSDKGEIPEKVIDLASKVSKADEFVDAEADGMDSHVAQNGHNFSGGQRQRISIARAIARQPEILIFDDSFSALDYKTDREVRENLKKYCSDTTKIIVAQRIGTIRNADRILVLADGKIVGDGTHDELMKNCETYQEIAYSQLSKEELA